jgi:lipoate-protein ligase A
MVSKTESSTKLDRVVHGRIGKSARRRLRCWRLILDGERPGSLNMALDDVLTRACEDGGQPTLRLYAWARPTLSLGRNQELSMAADLHACRRLGVDLVRRPTGGRAVLHENEVTYAVSVPASEPLLALGARAALGRMAEGIARGLEGLGVEARREFPSGRGHRQTLPPDAPCFAAVAADELTVKGFKVAAAAQWRLRRALLQHGSIPLSVDPARLMCVTGSSTGSDTVSAGEGMGLLRWLQAGVERTATESGRPQSLHRRVSRSMIAGLEETLEIRLRPGPLLDGELAAARALEKSVYASSAWTRRR